MLLNQGARIAVIGGGVSGIAAANILKKNGFAPVIFEKHERLGGVWAVSYPDVHLQNTYQQYHLSDFDWQFKPELHPSAEEIIRYFTEAVTRFGLELRLKHEVLELKETGNSWQVKYKNDSGMHEETFDYAVLAPGQYTDWKDDTQFPGQKDFKGQVVTERDIKSLEIFKGKRVAVVGFGKSALDMATLAAKQGADVQHIFRSPRWTIPEFILGVHYTSILFCRFGSVMMTSWAQPTSFERFMHEKSKGVIDQFWKMIASVFKGQIVSLGKNKDQAAKDRLNATVPTHPFLPDMRSAVALAPESYYPFVRDGKIQPHQTEVAGFTPDGIKLKNGDVIPCDVAVLSLGSKTPIYPFLPEKYRQLLEKEPDGAQLYRHLIHPHIPNLGFAGFNHGFMHIPSVEIGTLWLCAYLRGEIQLPAIEEMERTIEHVREWKRAHIQFEPSRSIATNTRYQQYLDILLKDLGMSPYRKLPNIFAEIFGKYGASDYAGVVDEYLKQRSGKASQLTPLPVHT